MKATLWSFGTNFKNKPSVICRSLWFAAHRCDCFAFSVHIASYKHGLAWEVCWTLVRPVIIGTWSRSGGHKLAQVHVGGSNILNPPTGSSWSHTWLTCVRVTTCLLSLGVRKIRSKFLFPTLGVNYTWPTGLFLCLDFLNWLLGNHLAVTSLCLTFWK